MMQLEDTVTALLFLFLFVHPVFVLECSAPGFSRLFAPHWETTRFTVNICSPLKLQKPGRLSHSLLMKTEWRINDKLHLNHRQICLESPTNLSNPRQILSPTAHPLEQPRAVRNPPSQRLQAGVSLLCGVRAPFCVAVSF